MTDQTLFAARDISKAFGSLQAVDSVSLTLEAGEIVALLGENGAGKSTFVKMMFGALQPDSGAFFVRGAPTVLKNPSAARAAGIGMVHQHFSLFDAFTGAQNLALVMPSERADAVGQKARALGQTYGLPIDPDALVADLSVGERQRIEIVRCLMERPDIIIMDEPTSVLTPQEAERLFKTLKSLAAEGRAVLYISHKLDEVRALCDRAVVLRRGRLIGTYDARTTPARTLAEAMVGAKIPAVAASPGEPGAAALAVKTLSRPSDTPFGTALHEVSLTLHAGEVLGIAGMAGNGQSELFAALSGETLSPREAIAIDGAPAGHLGIEARRAMGAAFVPEERLGHGTVPTLTLTDNVVLSRRQTADRTTGPGGFLSWRAARRAVSRVIAAMDVRPPNLAAPAKTLSGGNLQKYVMGRELDRAPGLLIVNQPTWGVDAGAAAAIRQALVDRARAGGAVLVISQDLDELFAIADRMAVIAAGRLTEPAATPSLTRADVGLAMAKGFDNAA
ncbi:MAG: ABC transporter ATP-binding protein [Pseudomonadota bacterium]